MSEISINIAIIPCNIGHLFGPALLISEDFRLSRAPTKHFPKLSENEQGLLLDYRLFRRFRNRDYWTLPVISEDINRTNF